MKLGAVVYALIAIGLGVSAVLIFRHVGVYAGLEGWSLTATAIVVALTGVVFAAGAVTRRGLVGDDGPWICQYGWLVVIALTAAAFVISLLSDQEGFPVWPTGSAVFVPHWIRRMQESYHDGVADAEREIAAVKAAERDGELRPVS